MRPTDAVARLRPLLLTLLMVGCSASPGAPDGGDAGAGVDAGIDSGVDAGPAFRCIGALPDAGAVSASPSLGRDASVVFTAELDGGWLGGQLVVTSDRFAVASGDTLHLFALDGGAVAAVRTGPVFQNASSVVASPNGDFFFVTSRVTRVDSAGVVGWTYSFGPSVSPFPGGAVASWAALAPDGTLVVAASDGYLHAVDTAQGSARWTRPIDLSHDFVAVGPGVGDTVFLNGTPLLLSRGEPSPLLRVGEAIARVRMASSAGLLAEVEGPARLGFVSQGHAFSFCGAPRWTLPNSMFESWTFELAGFDEALYVRADLDETASVGYIYSADGGVRHGPTPLTASPTVLGADGTSYVVDCAYQTVSALTQTRETLWTLPLGRSCTASSAALADNGMLYLALQLEAGQSRAIELMGIQTASPGEAKTDWPALRHDGRRTNWLGQ